ncbi:hypothetical protein ACFQVA_23150 [Actinomadura keratinilytica]
MSEEWQSEPAPVRSRPDREAVLADARTLLDRYGPDAEYWTNAIAAAPARTRTSSRRGCAAPARTPS